MEGEGCGRLERENGRVINKVEGLERRIKSFFTSRMGLVFFFLSGWKFSWGINLFFKEVFKISIDFWCSEIIKNLFFTKSLDKTRFYNFPQLIFPCFGMVFLWSTPSKVVKVSWTDCHVCLVGLRRGKGGKCRLARWSHHYQTIDLLYRKPLVIDL